MKQTAVETLMQKLFGENFRMTISDENLNAFQEGLQIEKEQIEDAYEAGIHEKDSEDYISHSLAYSYYNETFGNQGTDATTSSKK